MFEKKLRALMESRNMKLNELAKVTGVPKTNIQQWMTGSAPNIFQIDRVATFFGISLEELVFDRKPMKSNQEDVIEAGTYKVTISRLTKKDF